jgi:hypothetical protein
VGHSGIEHHSVFATELGELDAGLRHRVESRTQGKLDAINLCEMGFQDRPVETAQIVSDEHVIMQLGGETAGDLLKERCPCHKGIVDAVDVGIGNRNTRVHQRFPLLRDAPLAIEANQRDLYDPAAVPRACGFQIEHSKTAGAIWQKLG